jgi:predicted nuclease of predicted toxin-antitoxin system
MSTIRFKLDEDLSSFIAVPFRDAGIDVATVREQGWIGMADDVLLQKVSLESRILVTADRGFSDIRVYPPGSHAGIVVLRPDQESIARYAELVTTLIKSISLESLARATTIVSHTSIRTRRQIGLDPT